MSRPVTRRSASSSQDDPDLKLAQISLPNSSKSMKEVSSSRPLLVHTLTMSSGSSAGADTQGSSTSGSDILSCSEASTEIETPPETPARELLDGAHTGSLPPRSPGSPTEPTPKISYVFEDHHQFDFVRTRAYFSTYLPSEVFDDEDDLETLSVSEVHRLNLHESYPAFENEKNGEGVYSWADVTGHRRRGRSLIRVSALHHQRQPSSSSTVQEIRIDSVESFSDSNVDLPARRSLKRSHRPPPLDLSVISSRASSPVSNDISSAVGVNDMVPTSSIESSRPSTAPLPSVLPLDAERLPPVPATAPIYTLPKAPRIRPTVDKIPRSPSPLTLPSPKIPWSGAKGALRSSKPLRAEPAMPSTFHVMEKKRTPRLPSGQRRKVSLSKQIAELQSSCTISPVPPSLVSSPLLTRRDSPFMIGSPSPASVPTTPPTRSFLMSPGQPANATPLRLHMNPYFSQVVLSDLEGKRVSTSTRIQVDRISQHPHNDDNNIHPATHYAFDHEFINDVVDTGIY
ncbi:hypothetical protein FRC17_000482 [Serendipita sp. 399]|nr:hypothetical protein FRC17_000482 [Serendipita sp. 399]